MNNFFSPFVEQLMAMEREVGKSSAVNTLLEMLEQMLSQRSVLFIEVRELLERCSYETPTDVFNALMEHLAKSTLMYRMEIEREQRRKVVEQLFNELDFAQVSASQVSCGVRITIELRAYLKITLSFTLFFIVYSYAGRKSRPQAHSLSS